MIPNTNGSWQERLIHSFQGPPDGEEPQAGLVLDQEDNLYGTTQYGGGPSGGEAGVVFRLVPGKNGKWSEEILHTFAVSNGDGEQPWDPVSLDAAGNVYGTTSWGGDYQACGGFGCGVVFKLKSGSSKETFPLVFHDNPGASPYSGLTFDSAGNLYGTTAGDGVTTFGSVYEIVKK
jgi:hypothetical protein